MLIDIFSIGEKTSNGIALNYTVEDLTEIAEIYNNSNQQAPLVFTHNGTEAAGWCKKLYVRGDMLQADIHNISEDFIKNVIKERKYANISIRLSNDKKLKHIALLGADIPADSNLTTLDFNDNDNINDIVYDFASPTIIDITGIIGYNVTLNSIAKQIDKKDNILIRLYSPGGSVSEAKAILNILKPKEPKVMIYGDTASAGTIIAMCAGKGKLGIANNANFLIHEARYGLMGYYKANELNDMEYDLNIENKTILNIYKQRNENIDFAKLTNDIQNEKSYTASQAKNIGLVDFIFDPAKEDLDFSLNVANSMLYELNYNKEQKENNNNNSKELEMENQTEKTIVVDNSEMINELTNKLNQLTGMLEKKNEVIEALSTDLQVRKENEIKNIVKETIKEISNNIHIDSENINGLTDVLTDLRTNNLENFTKLTSVLNVIKPKAPQGEFVPENLPEIIENKNSKLNDLEQLDKLILNYIEKHTNMTYNEVFDKYVNKQLTLEDLK